MIRAALLLLGCLLAFDAATPLLPGAFRFAPEESVEALHARERPHISAAMPRLDASTAPIPRALPVRHDAFLKRPRLLPPRTDLRREGVDMHARADGRAPDDD
jgi:hypothetical protein